MNIILFDGRERLQLQPLTLTRPVGDLRIGILTIAEKWEMQPLGEHVQVSYMTEGYLATKYKGIIEEVNVLINSSLLPSHEIVSAIKSLKVGQRLVTNKVVLATAITEEQLKSGQWDAFENISYEGPYVKIERPWDIFRLNGSEIKQDLALLDVKKVKADDFGVFNRQIGEELYASDSASFNDVTFDTTSGPIYIGKDAKVLEGSRLKGPLAICEGAVIKMSAKIYGETTIGPFCKVGGEIHNSVFHSYSNKGHDGYVGNSVIGSWCNLGADTNTSNLKNNYGEVKVYHYDQRSLKGTGLQFCGVIMGDHAKTGINTMLNTGTVVGVCANVFGEGFPPKYIPSFSWGGFDTNSVYQLLKAFEVAEIMMERRKVILTDEDKIILKSVFDLVYSNQS